MKKLTQSLRNLADQDGQPEQRVAGDATSEGGQPTSEGGQTRQEVEKAPEVTTTTNPTAPATVREAPRTHKRHTRANTPGQLPAIIRDDATRPTRRRSPRINTVAPGVAPLANPPQAATTPNSNRIPRYSPNIISQEALNLVTVGTSAAKPEVWAPREFVTSSPNTGFDNSNVNIEHLCAPMVHPVTGEMITSYRKLKDDPVTKEV